MKRLRFYMLFSITFDLIHEFVSLVSLVIPNIKPQISTIVTKERANFATDLYLSTLYES